MPRALTVGARLKVVSLAAGRAGVRAGMTIAEARARCATLEVRPWDEHAIADAILAATTALLAASPQVTPATGTPGMWWVGATGFEALGGEEQLADTLLTLARQWHPDARVAIADTCVAARAATWAPTTTRKQGAGSRKQGHPLPAQATIIPNQGCARYLAPAPLGLLPMPDELRDALRMLGLTTVGALAALDAGDVEQRWGPEGLAAWRMANGHDPRRPGLVRVEAPRSASVELPGAVESAEPVLFVLRAQLQRLLHQCVHDGRAAASVAITLVLDAGRQYPIEEIGSELRGHVHVPETSDDTTREQEAGGRKQETTTPASCFLTPASSNLLSIPQRSITREVRPARPLARLEPLFDQCRALLEQWPIPAPIIGVTVSIPATAPLTADQGDLLVPSWRDAAMNAEAVFARLRAVLDPQNRGDVVVHPDKRDTHRVEETGTWQPADAITQASAPVPVPALQAPAVTASAVQASAVPASAVSASAVQAVRAIPASAVPASALSPISHLTSPISVLRLLPSPAPVDVELPHGLPAALWWNGRRLDLTAAHGPERLSGDWWRGDGYARDYWRCTAPSDGELLLYHTDSGWFVQGWYD